MEPKKVYFAHPIYTYNSPLEVLLYQALTLIMQREEKPTMFVCPNMHLSEVFGIQQLNGMPGKEIMDRCIRYVRHKADAVVALALSSMVPKGCHTEITEALLEKKEVFIFHFSEEQKILHLSPLENIVVYNEDDWKVGYAKVTILYSEYEKVGELYVPQLDAPVKLYVPENFRMFA